VFASLNGAISGRNDCCHSFVMKCRRSALGTRIDIGIDSAANASSQVAAVAAAAAAAAVATNGHA
jgi:hypothetical protein